MSAPLSPTPFDIAPRRAQRCEEVISLVDRLGVIGELTSMLEMVTRPGQDHVMQRVLSILRPEVVHAAIPPTDPRTGLLTRALHDLEQESVRTSPNLRVFGDRARLVVVVLSQTESQPRPW